MESKRQKISPKSQNTEMEWRVLAKCHAAGSARPEHKHRTGQLIFALGGVMLVKTGSMRWTVPPQRALWIPAGHPHSIAMLSQVEMRTVYFQPALIEACSGFLRKHEVHAVVASSLLKDLILGLFDEQRDVGTRSLMARLVLHMLRETACLPTFLPMPRNERLHGVLTMLIAANGWNMPVHEVASRAAMSERTFSRRFNADVGLTFRTWRQRARIIASLDMLAANSPVKAIASTLQFASSAAYVSAFRQLLGCAPNEFRDERRTNPP